MRKANQVFLGQQTDYYKDWRIVNFFDDKIENNSIVKVLKYEL